MLAGLRLHNTLFDENAACRIGLQFTLCEGGAPSEEDFAVRGGNVSPIHVDFMIGSDKIDVNGALAMARWNRSCAAAKPLDWQSQRFLISLGMTRD